MIYLFRSTKACYIILCIAIGAVIVYYGYFAPDRATIHPALLFLLSLLNAFISVFVIALICNRVAIRKYGKLSDPLLDACNFHEYIDLHNSLLQRKSNKMAKAFLLLNLSTGYSCIGDNAATKQVLDSIEIEGNSASAVAQKICYFNNLALYYLQVNDVENAVHALEEMKNALQNKKLSEKARSANQFVYSNCQTLINMHNGNYYGAEEFYRRAFEQEVRIYRKVSESYSLGRIYMHYGRLGEAKDAFKYVTANGGDTFYVASAHNSLDRISEMEGEGR